MFYSYQTKRLKNKNDTATRNIKNWADSAKYEHFNIK